MDQLSRLQCQFRRAIYPFMPFALGKRKRIRPIEDYGRISRSRTCGHAVIEAIRPLGVQILLNDPPQKETLRKAGKPHEFFLKMEELQEKCDIISFHTPLITKVLSDFHLCEQNILQRIEKAPHHYQYKPGSRRGQYGRTSSLKKMVLSEMLLSILGKMNRISIKNFSTLYI